MGSDVSVNGIIKRRFSYLEGLKLKRTCVSQPDDLISMVDGKHQHALKKEISLFAG